MPATHAAAPFSPTHYTSFCINLSWFHSLNSFQNFGQKLILSNQFKIKMTAPLQIIFISDYERTIIYQIGENQLPLCSRERERLACSPFNVLAANQQWQEWSTNSQIMLPNYVLDHIDLLRQERKRMYESPTTHQSYPAREKTELNDTGYLKESTRKKLFSV